MLVTTSQLFWSKGSCSDLPMGPFTSTQCWHHHWQSIGNLQKSPFARVPCLQPNARKGTFGCWYLLMHKIHGSEEFMIRIFFTYWFQRGQIISCHHSQIGWSHSKVFPLGWTFMRFGDGREMLGAWTHRKPVGKTTTKDRGLWRLGQAAAD